MSDIEEWRPIRGFEGSYEVSNMGRVRSLSRVISRSDGTPGRRQGQIMKLHTAGDGYLFAGLRKNGGREQRYVHRLVAEAFIPGDTSLPVNHCDCDKHNNRSVNLEWTTSKLNAQHAGANGRIVIRPETALAMNNPAKAKKLSAECVASIRSRTAAGELQRDIARSFDVNPSTVSKIVRGKQWGATVKHRKARAEAPAPGGAEQ